MEILDPTQYRWSGGDVIGRWYDRRSKKVEEQLGDAMVALAAASTLAKHRRAEAEAKARIEAEEAERRRKDKARREREKKPMRIFVEEARRIRSIFSTGGLRRLHGPQAGSRGVWSPSIELPACCMASLQR